MSGRRTRDWSPEERERASEIQLATKAEKSYTRDDGIDRAALAERNRRVMLARGENPAFVDAIIGAEKERAVDAVPRCPYCGEPRARTYNRLRKTCGKPGCRWRGHPRTDETREKMAAARRGRRRPDVAEALRGRPRPPEVREKISATLRERHGAAQREFWEKRRGGDPAPEWHSFGR